MCAMSIAMFVDTVVAAASRTSNDQANAVMTLKERVESHGLLRKKYIV